MPGFHKRREYKYEGTVESVYLTDGMSVEVIADGIHLPATILKLVYKLKGVEQTCLVTDALKYAANEGGTIDDPKYIIENGVCKLADHSSLAGSLATMDVLIQTMVKKPPFHWPMLFAWLPKLPPSLLVSNHTKELSKREKTPTLSFLTKTSMYAAYSLKEKSWKAPIQ